MITIGIIRRPCLSRVMANINKKMFYAIYQVEKVNF